MAGNCSFFPQSLTLETLMDSLVTSRAAKRALETNLHSITQALRNYSFTPEDAHALQAKAENIQAMLINTKERIRLMEVAIRSERWNIIARFPGENSAGIDAGSRPRPSNSR